MCSRQGYTHYCTHGLREAMAVSTKTVQCQASYHCSMEKKGAWDGTTPSFSANDTWKLFGEKESLFFFGLVYIYARVSIAVMNTVTKSSLEKKELICLTLPCHRSSLKEVISKTCRQDLMQWTWKDTDNGCLIIHHGLLSLLSDRTRGTQFSDGTSKNGLDPPSSIIN